MPDYTKFITLGIICLLMATAIYGYKYYIGSEDRRLNEKMANKMAIIISDEYKNLLQSSVNKYTKLKGQPPDDFIQLIYEFPDSSDVSISELKDLLEINGSAASVTKESIKIKISNSKIAVYFYLNGTEVNSKIK